MGDTNIFEIAQAAYKDSLNDIKNMSQLVEKVLKNAGQKYDYKITLKQFDILLQYSLLQIAAADNDIDENEIAFIRDITQCGDLCDYLRIGKSLLDTIRDAIIELAHEFVAMFVSVDKTIEYDFLGDLKRNVTAVILATCRADGQERAEELTNGCLIISVIKTMEQLINK